MRPITTKHSITVISINQFMEVEWVENITTGRRQSAVKKAREILTNCDANEKTEVIKSEIGKSLIDGGTFQKWTIGDKPKPKKDNSTPRQQTRRAKLNEAATRAGFDSWSKLETAVIKGELIIK